MRHGNPRGLWDEVRRRVKDWIEDDEESDVEDPSLVFHLALTAPLLIGLLLMARRG